VGGVLGMTSNTGQWFGVRRTAWDVGWVQRGRVALGTALGGLLADLALGADSALLRDAQALPPAWLAAGPTRSSASASARCYV